jgi:hypothetical protein
MAEHYERVYAQIGDRLNTRLPGDERKFHNAQASTVPSPELISVAHSVL